MSEGNPLKPIRWLPVRNTGSTPAPAFGLLEILGCDNDGTLQVGAPAADSVSPGQLLIVGAANIDAGGYGVAHNSFPAAVLYDANGGTPAYGAAWGAASGSFLLTLGKLGFTINGGSGAGAGLVSVSPAPGSSTSTTTNTLIVNNSATFNGPTIFNEYSSDAVTSFTLTSDQTDWNVSTARVVEITVTSSNININSISATGTNGSTARYLYVRNAGGSTKNVTIKNNGTATNAWAKVKPSNSSDIVLLPGYGIYLFWVPSFGFWVDYTTLALYGGGTDVDISVQSFSNANYVVTGTAPITIVHQTGTMTAPRTVTLPAASTAMLVIVQDTSGTVTVTNSITVSRAGADTVNNGTAVILSYALDGCSFHSDGVSAWGTSYTAGDPYATIVSTTDTTSDYLVNKLSGTANRISVTKHNASANEFLQWDVGDSHNNLAMTNFIAGYSTTATAGATTTLTVSSNAVQYFTGSLTQTVQMPVTSTLVLGQSWTIVNNSTGDVTVTSSGGNTIDVLHSGVQATYTCILTSGTTAASWNSFYTGFYTETGTGSVVLSTSPTLVTPLLGTPTSGVLTNCTGYPGDSSLVTTGTIATGTWHATIIGQAYGGTGKDTSGATNGQLLIGKTSDNSLNLAAPTSPNSTITITLGAGTLGLDVVAVAGAVNGPPLVMKATSTTSTGTALLGITGLSFSAAASATYLVEFFLRVTPAPTATGLAFAITGPTGASLAYQLVEGTSTTTTTITFDDTVTTIGNPSATIFCNNAAGHVHFRAQIATAGNAGTVQLKVADDNVHHGTVSGGFGFAWRQA